MALALAGALGDSGGGGGGGGARVVAHRAFENSEYFVLRALLIDRTR
jgi:hypothetical protein